MRPIVVLPEPEFADEARAPRPCAISKDTSSTARTDRARPRRRLEQCCGAGPSSTVDAESPAHAGILSPRRQRRQRHDDGRAAGLERRHSASQSPGSNEAQRGWKRAAARQCAQVRHVAGNRRQAPRSSRLAMPRRGTESQEADRVGHARRRGRSPAPGRPRPRGRHTSPGCGRRSPPRRRDCG